MTELIDSHSHLDVAEFDSDRAEVLKRAQAAGVNQQVVPAIRRSGWSALRELCSTHAGLHPAYGLHPMFLQDHKARDLEALAAIVEEAKPVAVGECGLDFFVEGLDREDQYFYFMRQLELARERDLPVIVHARRAFDEVTAAFRRIGRLRGVVHSFSGSARQAEQLWKLGFSLGIGGPVTYPRARRLREIVAGMPEEFLLLETDSPDQPLCGHQGERNEPAFLVDVLETVAALRGESEQEVAATTSRNARRLFNLPDVAAVVPAQAGTR
ncbi:MAG TPA: TatD family hydrolase [Dokdonella sp.]|jgi:TatD DNase family protein|nr:TatD family hydrolase [Dokdonella sp.]